MKNYADLIILGGGISGCAAAEFAARHGYSAVIVEPTGYLCGELTATGRASITQSSLQIRTPILPGALRKKTLAERLADGQEPLFFSMPFGRLVKNGIAVGVALANSYGLFALFGRKMIDTQAVYSPAIAPDVFRYTFEVTGVESYFEPEYNVPECFGNRVSVEDAFLNHRAAVTFTGTAQDDARVRVTAYNLFRWMKENLSPFAESKLSRLANRVVRRSDSLFVSDCPGWLSYRLDVPMCFTKDDVKKQEDQLLSLLGKESIYASETAENDFDVIEFPDGTRIGRDECGMTLCNDDCLPFVMYELNLPQERINRRLQTRAVIAGAGTSGFTAFQALTDNGIAPVIIEASEATGGTNVAGRVTGNWHGYIGGINESRAERLKELADTGISGPVPAASIMQYLTYSAGEYRPLTLLCGTILRGNTVKGVIAADRCGLLAIEADITIDATGDATVAALAGLPTHFGFVYSGLTQTYSQFGEEYWSNDVYTKNRFQGDPDMLYQMRYSELLRGTYLAHRYNSDFDFSPYPTVRESRRIVGDYSLSIKDIYEEKRHYDDVAVTSTPFDSHGMCENLLGNLDICRCNHAEEMRAHIPYRCYLPKGIEGLLVTAKSFSGSRDAVNVCRMNPDLRNAGYAIGLAAYLALRDHVGLRKIKIGELRKRLLDLKILPEWETDPEPSVDWTLPPDDRFNTARALLATLEMPALGGADSQQALIVRAWNKDPEALDAAASTLVGEPTKMKAITALVLIGNAARVKDIPAVSVYLKHVTTGGPVTHKETNYNRTRFDGWRYPNDRLIQSVCYACDRLASKDFIPELERLLTEIGKHACDDRIAPPSPFFAAFTELRVGVSLARCDSETGREVLRRYAGDARYTLRRFAEQELKDAELHPGLRPRKENYEYDALF